MSGSIFTLRLTKINILFGCFQTLNITPKICCPVLITQLLPTQKLTCVLWTLTYVTSLATSDNNPTERQRDIQLHQHKSILTSKACTVRCELTCLQKKAVNLIFLRMLTIQLLYLVFSGPSIFFPNCKPFRFLHYPCDKYCLVFVRRYLYLVGS